MKNKIDLLSKSPLFHNISQDDLLPLLSCIGAKELNFQKNETVMAVGSPVTYVGILLEGSLQIIKDDLFGNRAIVTTIHVGDLFAESFACARLKTLPITVIAESKSKLLALDFNKILLQCDKLCSFHSKLIENMLFILAERNLFLTEKIDILSKRTSRDKILSYLSLQAKLNGTNSFTIPLNRQGMADYLCIDRSALSSLLAELKREGIIFFHKNQFQLLQPPDDAFHN